MILLVLEIEALDCNLPVSTMYRKILFFLNEYAVNNERAGRGITNIWCIG